MREVREGEPPCKARVVAVRYQRRVMLGVRTVRVRHAVARRFGRSAGDDTMTRFEREFLEREPGWSDVLAAYARDADRRQADGVGGAVPCSRVDRVEGIDPTRLSRIHGKLIALGLLQFRLVDRHVGLQYEVTPRGRELLQVVGR